MQTPLLGESFMRRGEQCGAVLPARVKPIAPSRDEILTKRLGDGLGTIASS
jgi:hypothetical protein